MRLNGGCECLVCSVGSEVIELAESALWFPVDLCTIRMQSGSTDVPRVTPANCLTSLAELAPSELCTHMLLMQNGRLQQILSTWL